VGIYVYYGTTSYYMCIVRDIVAGGQVVADGQTLTVDYIIGVTV